jgi:hypothetical protein
MVALLNAAGCGTVHDMSAPDTQIRAYHGPSSRDFPSKLLRCYLGRRSPVVHHSCSEEPYARIM